MRRSVTEPVAGKGTTVKALDKSRVPQDKRDDPRLLEDETTLMSALQNKPYRTAVCVHEAAHGVYMLRAGAKHLLYHPPLAFYNTDTDSFVVGAAGIEPDFGEAGVKAEPLVVGRWVVAGGVAQLLLTNTDDKMGACDEDFAAFPRTMRRYVPEISDAEIDECWKTAALQVAADLRSPMVRKEIWHLAHEFEAWLLEEK